MDSVDAIVERTRGSPLALAKVARSLVMSKGDSDRAIALCEEALAAAPDDPEVRAIHAEVLTADIGRWYFSMLRDEGRNAAYDRVLRRALSSGGRVLEIGTGTGLFAMMAARAGADEVISCERRPAVARGARAVIAHNALDGRIKVVAKASSDVEIGVDMAGPADLVIWDNLANNLIGIGALAAIEDAMRRLVRPGASVIPARCAIKAALAEDRDLDRRRAGPVEGFDLSPFNAFAQPVYTINCQAEDFTVRSDAVALFEFDLRSGGPYPRGRTARPVKATGGRTNGVVQWLEFGLDDHETYETSPVARVRAFGMEFHPVAAAFEAQAGESLVINAAHDRERLRIWLGDA